MDRSSRSSSHPVSRLSYEKHCLYRPLSALRGLGPPQVPGTHNAQKAPSKTNPQKVTSSHHRHTNRAAQLLSPPAQNEPPPNKQVRLDHTTRPTAAGSSPAVLLPLLAQLLFQVPQMQHSLRPRHRRVQAKFHRIRQQHLLPPTQQRRRRRRHSCGRRAFPSRCRR